jgi:hypothetical protein
LLGLKVYHSPDFKKQIAPAQFAFFYKKQNKNRIFAMQIFIP